MHKKPEAPPLQFALRSKQGLQVYECSEFSCSKEMERLQETCDYVSYSPDGRWLAACYKDRVVLLDAASKPVGAVAREIMEPNVHMLSFSSKCSYMVTLRKYVPEDPAGGNLSVWQLASDETLAQQASELQKKQREQQAKMQDQKKKKNSSNNSNKPENGKQEQKQPVQQQLQKPELQQQQHSQKPELQQQSHALEHSPLGVYKDVKGNKCVLREVFKPSNEEVWPVIQWDHDEHYAAVLNNKSNSLRFYEGSTMKFTGDTLGGQYKVSWFTLSGKNHVAVFSSTGGSESGSLSSSKNSSNNSSSTGGSGGGMVHVFRCSNVAKPTLSHNVGAVSSIELKWNKSAGALLIKTIDNTSDKSYYGSSHLFLMNITEQTVHRVNLGSEDSLIHDAQWSPKGNEFMVIHGIPAHVAMHNLKGQLCAPVGSFGEQVPFNKIAWSPHSKLVALIGTGSMKGGIEIWDREEKRKIGANVTSDFTFYSWSPDDSMLLTATLTPTLRVDNKFQLCKYNGLLEQTQHFDTLYQALWRPGATEHTYLARPPSPRGLNAAARVEKSLEKNPPKAYVPPHLRAMQSTTTGGSRSKPHAQHFAQDENPKPKKK